MTDIKKTIQKVKHDTVNAAHDIRRNTVNAYDVKHKEISEYSLYEDAAKKLTPEEIRKAEVAGLVVGILALVTALGFLALWLTGNLGWLFG